MAEPLTPAAPRWAGLERIPALWLVLVGILSVQFGAATAKGLFRAVPPTAVVWMRLATSAVVLLIMSRPQFRGRTRRDWLVVLGFGVCLAAMNVLFYQSFARIPLGLAVTIEFLGPLGVAVAGSRRVRDLAWVGLAGLGVALLGFSRAALDPLGVLFALLAGAGWAGYILLSTQTGRRWPGISGLGLASSVGAVGLALPVFHSTGSRLFAPAVLFPGLAVGVLSSVIPYSLELTALRRIPPRVFGILMSLEPAVAALVAMVVLSEFLGPTQWLAMVCVVAASVGATRTSRPVPPDG